MNYASGVWTAQRISSATVHPGGRRPFKAGSRLRYRFSPHVFRYEQIGSGTGFVPSNFVLSCQ